MKFRIFLLLISLPMIYSTTAFGTQTKYQIRWRINHTPEAYFYQAVEVFKNAVEKKTKGEVTVVADSASPEETTSPLLLKQVSAGDIEMAQVYTSDIATAVPAFNVFDLPYLIESHEQASRVFENRVGESLLAQLAEQTEVTGLGFTYSGGFVVHIGRNKMIEKVEDIRGATVKAFDGPFASRFLSQLGAQIVTTESPSLVSATYADLMNSFNYKKMSPDNYVFNETRDRLLVTTLVINKEFFNRLPIHHQKAVREAAIIASRAERKNIVESGIKIKSEVLKKRFKVVQLSENEKLRWKKKSESIYSKFFKVYPQGSQLVKEIQDEKVKRLAER